MEQLGPSGGENIKVFVRVRPPDPNLESELGRGVCLDVTSETTLTVYSKPEPKVFTFDHVADKNITQEDVFSAIGRPIIDCCMCGYNGTIFAYGQTGSGKTFTMIGPPSEDSSDTFTHELRGIIPRSFEYLFSFINRNKQKYGELVEFLCKCSFLEIYNEQVFDLLDPASSGLHLRENMKRGVYVDGVTETSVSSAKDAYQVLSTGWVNRKVASTSMNRESSRSHAVFTLSIESKKREAKDAVAKIRTSLLNLVDLAGSERQRDTQTAGLRLKEAGSINKSLSALGNVIMALVDIANGKSRHVHYRDSKLTFLLRDSLGGNAKTNLVANVHPSARCFGESLSTLNFARRAKMIRNKAIVNEDATGNVLQLQGEIKRLRGLIQRYKSENAAGPSTLHLSSPFPVLSDTSCRSDDEKAIQELKSMLTASIEARDRANIEKTELLDRVERQQQLSDKKDKFIQSTKMILKFREAHISNLEKAQKAKSPADSSQENTTKLQRQEIEHLKRLVEHHPDSGRLARENVDLKAELKKLRASVSTSGKENLSRQLDHSHQYTLQLERQLRHYLAKNSTNGISPMSARLAPSTPTKATFDLEGLQVRCKQLQEELENTRRLWNHEREDLQLRESKLEANLTAARKANMELERSIEALKLKNNVEKSTLNDIHMATIKTILTPKRERDQLFRNRSMSCTPTSHIHRADSDPIKHQLSFVGKAASIESPLSHPSSPLFPTISEAPERQKDSHLLSGNGNGNSTPHAKKPRLSQIQTLCESEAGNDVSEKIDRVPKVNGIAEILEDSLNEEGIGRGEEEEEEEEELDELNVRGALTDELKILQDRNRSLQQQLEDLERRVVHLTQVKGALEAQVEELTQLSRLEREGYYDKEQGYLEKIANLASQIADLKSTNGVLESEVYDLRVCLKSADKELKEVKDEKGEMKRSHDSKVMSYAQKIGELERLYSSEESKYNRAMEELQNLQDEVETLREELTFKDHRISELEEVLKKEKEAVSAHEVEVQSLLEKLTLEVERSTRLSLELQEGHTGNQELIATVNENTRLHDEVEQLESELQTRLQTHKRHMEEAEGTISALLKKKATDEAAITGFVATIQELRSEKVKDESRVVSMTRELEDSARDLAAAVTKNGDLAEKVEFLHKKLSEEAAAHGRELMKRDAEREIVFDDLESLNDQYQQLTMAFELQTRKLSETQVDLERANGELERVENEMSRLLQGKIEKRASTSKMQSLDEDLENNSEEEIKQLKRQLDQAAEMIEGYEKSREEKNKELQSMKEQVSMVEKLKEECDSLQATIAELHYKLSYEKEHEDSLSSQLQASTDVIKQLQQERDALITEKEIAIARNLEIAEKCQHHQECMAGLTEQIDRYKSSEENLFQAKENIRSQLEMLQEEKAKLSKECEKLAKENAAITGHHNIRQRIQYHATVKIENAKLKEEVIQLHSRLRRKTEQVDKLQHILTEKGLEITNSRHTSSKGRTINDANQQQQKENITP